MVAVALHCGAEVRPEVAGYLRVDAAQRRLEEDPHTDRWTRIAGSQIVARASRFEVDLNRPRRLAVYRGPQDAWGIDLWRELPPPAVLRESLRLRNAFYREAGRFLRGLCDRHGAVAVLDLHSFCDRRPTWGVGSLPDGAHPDVDVGTGAVERGRWGPLLARLVADLRSFPVAGRTLDVRENVRFRGGHFNRFVNRAFRGRAVCITLEVRKFFMDQVSGAVDEGLFAGVSAALAAAVPGVLEELRRLRG